jgi:hypothetical protein
MNEPLRYLAQVANAAKQSYRLALAGVLVLFNL